MSEPSAGAPTVESVLDALPPKPRVHELAKRLGLSNKALIARLADLGFTVSSSSASVARSALPELLQALLPILEPGSDTASSQDAVAAGLPEPTSDAIESPDEPADDAAGGVLFLPPQPTSRRRRGKGRRGSEADASAAEATPEEPTDVQPTVDERTDAEADAETEAEAEAETEAEAEAEAEGGGGRGRRRRRGRRGRGRAGEPSTDADVEEPSTAADGSAATAEAGAGPESTAPESTQPESTQPESTETDEDADSDDEAGETAASTRRRRRRRRRATGDDAPKEDDPDNTVVHVREARAAASSEVQGVRGSTRLEAKRQRRRDTRESRRRPHVLTEAEFLARRESVERVMAVRQRGELAQVALLEDGVLVEHFVSKAGTDSMIGSVFLGRVQNVLPSMEAAFVDIGRGRNAVLYAGEVNWDAAGLAGKARRIETALSSGDTVLAQVSKDPVGHKGARLTTQISLPGRFLVYVPGGGATGISRKLPDTERKRLKSILDRIVPAEAGVIIRTAAEGIAEEDLVRDVERLKAQWEDISRRADEGGRKNGKSSAPALLSAEPGTLIKVIRDMFNSDISRLVVDGAEAFGEVGEYVTAVAPELADRLARYEGDATGADVFARYRVDEQIAKALERKVHLPSGGSLVIDRTEAMTVVDVNTGKFTGSGGNLEETVTKNNLEAAEEIVRQLRLRDIGGIIVVDFIDMVLESNRELVLRRLTECLGRDRSRHQVAEVSSLGLVQMTRKRMGTGLLEAFSEPCPHCGGRGLLLHDAPLAGAQDVAPAEPRGKGRRSRSRAADGEDVVTRVQHALGRRPDPRGPKPPTSVAGDGDRDATANGEAAADAVEQAIDLDVAVDPDTTEPGPEALAEPVSLGTFRVPDEPELEPGPPAAEPEPEPGDAAAEPGPTHQPNAERGPEPPPAVEPARRRRRAASRPAGPAGDAIVAEVRVPANP